MSLSVHGFLAAELGAANAGAALWRGRLLRARLGARLHRALVREQVRMHGAFVNAGRAQDAVDIGLQMLAEAL